MWFRRIFQGKSSTIDHSGIAEREHTIRLTSNALRQLDHLQLSASRYLPGQAAGLRPSLRRMLATEFREHRIYVPGDDIRYVDWKASARQEHIFVRQGEYPKQATVYLFLDLSSSMSWGDPPKKDAQLQLAAALGYLALAHGDRLLVIPLSEKDRPVMRPLNGKGQFTGLLQYLNQLSYSGRIDLKSATKSFRGKFGTFGGLVFVLSDFLEVEDVADMLEILPAPRWDVVLFHLLHPVELNPDIKGSYELQDIESSQRANYDIDSEALIQYQDHLSKWRNDLELVCQNHNAFYTLIPTAWSLDRETISHLRKIDVVRPI